MVSVGILRNVQDSRAYDLAMRLPVALYSFYALGHDVLAFCVDARHEQVNVGFVVALLARASQWIFVALLGLLPLIRLRPIAKSDSLLPRSIALATVLIPPFCMLLPRAVESLALDLMSVVVSLMANILAVTALSFLGRSFSVMPEARRLVTSGPYGIVRHPLYLFELLGVTGIVLEVRSLTGIAALVAIATLQLVRARWEEDVLARAIPEFAAYRQRVPFLLPKHPIGLLALLRDDPASRRRGGIVLGVALGLAALLTAAVPLLNGNGG